MTQDELKQLVSYDLETGAFTWKRNGNIAGYPKTNGYWQVRINNKYYLMHRLAWLYVYGQFPAQIDHINRIRSDNRLCNLREVTRCQNQQNRSIQINNTSGFPGVVFVEKRKVWLARIKANNKSYHLGSFKSFECAVAARKEAEVALYKE